MKKLKNINPKKLITGIARIIASCISILTGTACIFFFSFDLLPYFYPILIGSLIVVILIEFLSVSFLNEFFKLIFAGNVKLIFFGVFALMIYTGSFFLSVNGITSFVENTQNKTEQIENINVNKSDSISNYYNAKIDKTENLLDSLQRINITWTNRNLLQDKINFLQMQVVNIQNKKDSALLLENSKKDVKINNNIIEVAVKKKEYYFATSLIIAIIFILNFIFNFLKHSELQDKKTAISEYNKFDIIKMLKKGMRQVDICKKTGWKDYQVSRINNKRIKNPKK